MQFSWVKKGLIFSASELDLGWATTSSLTPTPVKLNSDVIRVYIGFRDDEGVSRIGYVDVSFHDPSQVLSISEQPCLDLGEPGHFDDNGIILGDVVRHNETFRMYYVGFQLVKKAKFLAFSGLAESSDGQQFSRVRDFPILDRDANANTINAIHTVINVDGVYRVWHAKGGGWQLINDKPYPKYNIWTSTSVDGININRDAKLCVDVEGDEYRIGRPSVYKIGRKFIMFYTKGGRSGLDYYPGLAVSDDGLSWERRDDLFGIELSSHGWDSRHIAYPRLLQFSDQKYYVFYNGNDMGRDGFGYAELTIKD